MNRLKECRINANIKQEALAKMIGVTQGAISAWEVGRSEPSSQSWKKISEALGVSVDYLMGSDDPATAEDAPPDNIRLAFYGPVKGNLSDKDIEEITRLIAIKKKISEKKASASEAEARAIKRLEQIPADKQESFLDTVETVAKAMGLL